MHVLVLRGPQVPFIVPSQLANTICIKRARMK